MWGRRTYVRFLVDLQKSHTHRMFEKEASSGVDFNQQYWDSPDVRVHTEVLDSLNPVFETPPVHKILTIGDGRGGLEARYLKGLGHHVVASDLSPHRLPGVKEAGLIDDYLQLNAENLDVPDASFDFAFAKEMLHHCQRPYLALYEMLRVARRGVVIIEPHYRFPSTIRSCLRQKIRKLFRRDGATGPVLLPRVHYEPSGNLLYRFNPLELTQCALGMGITSVAFRYCRHFLNCPDGSMSGQELDKWIRKKKRKLAIKEMLNGKQHRALLCFMIFRGGIDGQLRNRLVAAGFHIPSLKPNPILQGAQAA